MSDVGFSQVYKDTDEMHDALNEMYKNGFEYCKQNFKPKRFASKFAGSCATNLTPNELDELEFKMLDGEAENYFHSWVYHKEYIENNPLGSGQEEWQLGYVDRAIEMLKIEKDGFIYKPNGETFSDRLETKGDK